MKIPDISVIVPVFNGEKYVGRCIRSLLAQSVSNSDFEIIVINDGSTDKTKYALDLFGSDIVVINHESQRGLPSALNSGIKHARGKFMVRLDSDDYVHAEYLNVLQLFLNLNNEMDAVACDYLEVSDKETIYRKVNCMEEPIGCGIMFRMSQLIEIGLYDEEMLLHEDKDLRHRFKEYFKIHRIALPLYRYRKHEDNITNNKDKMSQFYTKLNKKHSTDFSQGGYNGI